MINWQRERLLAKDDIAAVTLRSDQKVIHHLHRFNGCGRTNPSTPALSKEQRSSKP
jgi:hypothetical protein